MQQTLLLSEHHEKQGAQFKDYGTWRLPAHYGHVDQEYSAVREQVALCDLSYQGQLLISGQDSERFLQGLITNDLSLATERQGIYALLLSGKGKIIADFHLFRLSEGLLLDIDHENAEPTLNHLKRFRLRSKVDIVASDWAHLLVSGPKALLLLEAWLGSALPELAEGAFFETEAQGSAVKIIHRSLTGEVDFHLYLKPEKLVSSWDRLFELGKQFNLSPIGQETLETLRIEAGRGRFGIDFNEDILPIEANLQDEAISYSKGCYPGQEVIARIKTYGHVNKILTGLCIEGERVPSMGDLIFRDQKKVGWVTSATWSPALKKNVAFAYLRQEAATPGQALELKVDESTLPCTVQKRPFYTKPTP